MIEKILILQERDTNLARIQRELTDIPAHKEEILSRLNEHKAAQAAAADALKLQQARVKDLELEVESHKERLSKLKVQQMSLKTNTEFKVMEKEIHACEEKISSLEDGELVIMADVEAAQAALAVRDEELKAEEDLVNADLVAMDERAKQMESELTEIEAQRAAAAEAVDDIEWLRFYERLASNRPQPVAVPVNNGVCGGCHMRVPPQLVHNVARANEMVTCSNCGRILYRS